MDAFSEPLIEEIVCQFSSQSGKTEAVVNNVVGFHIDQEPCPILVVQPNVEPMAKAWSLDRLAPMLRDTPRLRNKVRDPRSRDSGNTILHKTFPGGHLTVAGANSPAGLASRPIRIALFDEVDRFPTSAGTEGDPVALGTRRTDTFWNRKIGLSSTPTIKGLSRIETAMEDTDQRRFFVPCPECGHEQHLRWAQLKWEEKKPSTAVYECEKCKALIEESLKLSMLRRGRWIATKTGMRKAGFYLNAIYSPWVRWSTMVGEWLKAQNNPELLRVFINTRLAETWEETGDRVDTTLLKREEYFAEVPNGVGVLTLGADVQGDRIEVEVRGWGAGEESWLIAHHRIYGDPEQGEVWERLDTIWKKVYQHESGMPMRIRSAGIDSSSFTAAVYKYAGPRQRFGMRALKGSSERSKPIVTPSKSPNRAGVRVWIIGTDTAKDQLFARLRIGKPGPGMLHFPQPQSDGADDAYLEQFGAEKAVIRFKQGARVKGKVREYIQLKPRNEAIDLYVYSLAALHGLGRGTVGVLGKLAERAQSYGKKSEAASSAPTKEEVTAAAASDPPPPDPTPANVPTVRRNQRGRTRRGGWVQNW